MLTERPESDMVARRDMSVTHTHPDRPDRATGSDDLPAQTAAYQHLDELRETEKVVPDDLRVGQAIVGGPPRTLPRDPVAAGIRTPVQPGWFDKLEAFVSRLSVRDNFWNSICSLLWLPLAFWSGIRMKEPEPGSFVAQAILPFRRFNRNWYRAMAGGALLANSEIAGGAYVFGIR